MSSNTAKTILVVDDELGIRELLKECLEDEGFVVKTSHTGHHAHKMLKEETFDLVLLDVWLPDLDGISILEHITKYHQETPVVMMSGHASISTALNAIKLGAKDFIEKPVSLSKLLPAVKKYVSSSAEVVQSVTDVVTINMNKQLKELKDYLEKNYFLYQLNQHNGNISKVAEFSGVDRAHLYRKFKNLGINLK